MRTFLRIFVALAAAGLFAGAAPAAAPAVAVPGEPTRGGVHPEDWARRQQALQRWLVSEQVPGAERSPIAVTVTRDEMRRQAVGDCEDCGPDARRQKVGYVKEVSAPVSFSDLLPEDLSGAPLPRRHGAIRATADGGYVWSAVATSPGAQAMRLQFSGILLPEGVELYVYNDAGQAFGPYTWAGPGGAGEFWSNTVRGEVVYLQIRHFGPTAARDLHGVAFDVTGVGHIDPGAFLAGPVANEQVNFSGCDTAACVEDAACHNVNAVNVARDAVGHMQWIKRPYIYICTGGLVADSDTSSQIPYFLTANHCISRDREAGSLEVFWFYETTQCGGSCYDPATKPSTLGATVVATNKTGDFTLMRLSGQPPAETAYLGWNADPVAFSDGAALHRISHPYGAPQAYSSHMVDTSAGTCSSWPRGSWIYSRDVVGATMGGSSGSPVVNGSGLIVGQLSGACGTNVNDVCDSASNATVDGAFASYYSQVAPYLGGGSSGNTAPTASFTFSCSGLECSFDGSASSDPDGTIVGYAWSFGDGGSASGAQVTHTYGGDGTFNVTLTVTDDDGATDGEAKPVTVGGGSCLPAGSVCTANADCCSNKCLGKPGSKTCK